MQTPPNADPNSHLSLQQIAGMVAAVAGGLMTVWKWPKAWFVRSTGKEPTWANAINELRLQLQNEFKMGLGSTLAQMTNSVQTELSGLRMEFAIDMKEKLDQVRLDMSEERRSEMAPLSRRMSSIEARAEDDRSEQLRELRRLTESVTQLTREVRAMRDGAR